MVDKRSTFTASLFDSKLLPRTWKLVAVGDVLDGTQYGLSEPGATDGDMPIVGMKDIVDGTVSLLDLATIDGDRVASARFELRRGDILLNRTNSPDLVGKVGIVREDSKAVFASYLVRLNADRSRINPEFLNFWLNSAIAQKALKRLSTRGVSQANINPTEFQKHCPVPLPPLSEQGRIAEILRTWDEAINAITRIVEARERQHLALTHQLAFGKRRLGNFSKSQSKRKHHWLDLPSDWQAAPIGTLAQEISERNSDRAATEVLSCSKYDGFVRSLEYFKKQVFSVDLTGYKRIWRGDFGFPSNHVEEGSIGLQDLADVGIVSPIYTVFRFDRAKIDNWYAFSVLKTSLYRHIFEVSTSASVDRRGSLRWKEFAKIEFPVPSLAEQQAISAVLAESRGLIDRMKLEHDALVRQKRGLMQKLLTGEWPVTVRT
jgi:type I restriction enzyme S subunit